MAKKKLKVFHGLVNYGTQSGMFAYGLRKRGVEAISVTTCDPFKRQTDVYLKTGGSFIRKILNSLWNRTFLLYCFFKYNTFHFYAGTSLFPKQKDLPIYRFVGKKVVMEYLGYDVQLYQYSKDKYEITNVTYYKSHDVSLLLDNKKLKRLEFESRYADKQLVCAPYLSEFVPSSEVLPLAIDLSEYKFIPKEAPIDEITILHAPTSQGNKGTKFIFQAIEQLKSEGYRIKVLLVENLTHAELREKYIECDIFIDQLLAGWYGTASIEAMAVGRPTVCFIRESYYKYIHYGDSIPIINASPHTIYDVLKRTIENKEQLPTIGIKSRKFVEDVHDLEKLTNQLITIYKTL